MSVKIKALILEGNYLLAPLAGVSDAGFRAIAEYFGAALTYTEMVSAKGLLYGNAATKALLSAVEDERPKAVQLFGSDPKVLAEAVKLPELAKFDLIDLNMGCPVPKIVGNGEGSALMKDPALASRIISACVSATDKPVTVKFRKGFDDERVNCVEFAKMCEDSGASLITVHGRTRKQMYAGRADWDCIGKVAAAVKIPVIGNGDVFSRSDAERMLAETGCAGVMVARGALGRPWIFAELNGQTPVIKLDEIIGAHIRILGRFYPPGFVVPYMRKHVAWYVKGRKNAARIRETVNACGSLDELLALVNSL